MHAKPRRAWQRALDPETMSLALVGVASPKENWCGVR